MAPDVKPRVAANALTDNRFLIGLMKLATDGDDQANGTGAGLPPVDIRILQVIQSLSGRAAHSRRLGGPAHSDGDDGW